MRTDKKIKVAFEEWWEANEDLHEGTFPMDVAKEAFKAGFEEGFADAEDVYSTC